MLKGGDLFDTAQLFVACAARLHPKARWPMESATFARVVEKLSAEGNTFARRFHVYDGRLDKACPDFDMVLSKALMLTFISYVAPEFKTFMLEVSGWLVRRLYEDYPEPDRIAADAVLAAYAEACGLNA